MKHVFLLCLLVPGLLSAGTPKMSQKRLDSVVKHWRHVLMLDDWDIEAKCVRLDEFPEGISGLSGIDPALQVEHIRVLDPRDYAELARRDGIREQRGKEIIRDIEETVLHEMLHLRLRTFAQAPNDKMQDAEEFTVNRLTTALSHAR